MCKTTHVTLPALVIGALCALTPALAQTTYYVDADCGNDAWTGLSPAINAGDPDYVPDQDETDIDGQPRVIGIAIDMGADEVPHLDANKNGIPDACECDPCDMNCDGEVNAFDIEPFLDLFFGGGEPCNDCTGDVNGDGFIDAFDIEPFLNCLFP